MSDTTPERPLPEAIEAAMTRLRVGAYEFGKGPGLSTGQEMELATQMLRYEIEKALAATSSAHEESEE